MAFVADQAPGEVEWATPPPPPLMEALETIHAIWQTYLISEEEHGHLDGTVCYQTAYNVMLRAFHEEWAP